MQLQMTITAGQILSIAAVLAALATIYRLAIRPLRIWMHEHDVMWEDISIRRGWSYRVSEGRGQARGIEAPKPSGD